MASISQEANGDWMVLHRFYIHLVPFIFIFLSISIGYIIKNHRALNTFLTAYVMDFHFIRSITTEIINIITLLDYIQRCMLGNG